MLPFAWVWLGFFLLGAVTAPGGAAPSKKAAPAKAGASRATQKAAPATKSSAKPAASRSRAKRRARPAYRSWRAGQQQPDKARYAEIQKALAAKGYLTKEADGNWDEQSTAALRRFQEDQHLKADGKIGSLALIALGLGPNRNPPPPAVRPQLPPGGLTLPAPGETQPPAAGSQPGKPPQ